MTTYPKQSGGFGGVEQGTDRPTLSLAEAVYEPREGFIDMEMDLFLSLHRAVGEDKVLIVHIL